MTGGVVRRDGLREAAELAREILSHFDHRGHPGRDCRRTGWVAVEMVEAWSERLRVLDAVPDVPPTEARLCERCSINGAIYYHAKNEPCQGIVGEDDATRLPDVPPDPPAVDRETLARLLWESSSDYVDAGEFRVEWPDNYVRSQWYRLADALLSSGVLVAAADVRARAQEAAWDEGYTAGHSNAMRRMSDEPNAPTSPNPYTDRAVSEREGAT